MTWTPATPEKRIETLERQVADLQRIVDRLQSRAALAPAPRFDWLSDRASTPWRHDAALQAPPMPPPPVAFRHEPVAHTWDVATPFKAGLASGLMSAIAATPFAIMGWFGAAWYTPIFALCFTGPLTFYTVCVWRGSAMSMIKERVEPMLGVDLNGDGQVGEPPTPTVTVRVEKMGGGWSYDDLPSPSRDGLFRFAQALSGQMATFSERGASRYGYSRQLWKALSEKFLQHEPPWAEDLGGKQGLRLTGTGKRLVNAIAETEPEGEE